MPGPEATDGPGLHRALSDRLTTAAGLAAEGALGRDGADQLTVMALTLAMLNAVAQQQQLYMLQNAATTAMVSALLEAGPDGASRYGDALRLVREAFSTAEVDQTLARLQALIDQVTSRVTSPA